MLNRRDAGTQRFKAKLATNLTNCTNFGSFLFSCNSCNSWLRYLPFLAILFVVSCGSKPTDVRAVMPGDAQVYLEANDVGKALRAVTEHEAFRKAAKTSPDLSVLDGVKLAIAVTGFKKEDEQADDEQVVGKVIPQFVAAAETNAWNYQAIGFTENKLGEFVNDIYGGGVQLERFPRHEGDYFIWTAQDGRKAYGLVIGSLVFFGNDESALEKCIAVRKGEGDSFAAVGKLPAGEHLASGYVSPEGIGQISNIAAIQLAIGSGEEEESRRFIAAVLPEIIRNSIKEVTWTASKTETGITDRHLLTLEPGNRAYVERDNVTHRRRVRGTRGVSAGQCGVGEPLQSKRPADSVAERSGSSAKADRPDAWPVDRDVRGQPFRAVCGRGVGSVL